MTMPVSESLIMSKKIEVDNIFQQLEWFCLQFSYIWRFYFMNI